MSTLSSLAVIRKMLGEMARLRGELKAMPPAAAGAVTPAGGSADDFGLTDGVCRAVLRAHRTGS